MDKKVFESILSAKEGAKSLRGYNIAVRNEILKSFIYELQDAKNREQILASNKKDIEIAEKAGRDITFIDRLRLTENRIDAMIEGVEQIVDLYDPLGEDEEERRVLKSGLILSKRRVPFGVVCIIYEARPNVTVDATALCIKSGNVPLLKGGTDAINTNQCIFNILSVAIEKKGLDKKIISFFNSTNRDDVAEMLKCDKHIDIVIPRGGEKLKEFVKANATMPVIASSGGNCHIYIDEAYDEEEIIKVIINAKTQRPSTCNALEHILINKKIENEFTLKLIKALIKNNVEILGDKEICELSNKVKLAEEQDYLTEFLKNKLTIQYVKDVKKAVEIINENSTGHSEAILSNNRRAQQYFADNVDSAAVYINASTRFTDGFEFGLGAEMGISTQKLHARGPIGLKELTTTKYVIVGTGQVRE